MKTSLKRKSSFLFNTLFVFFMTTSLFAQHVEITAPAGVAGNYPAKPALFGPGATAISGAIVLADDGDDELGEGTVTDACQVIINDVSEKIALIDKGICSFVQKATNAQNAGAIAVIICNTFDPNNANATSYNAQGSDMGINIPVVMLTFNQCETVKMGLAMGLTGGIVEATEGESCETAIEVTEGAHSADPLTGGGGLSLYALADNISAKWYKYTASMNGLVTINSCMGGTNTRLVVGNYNCNDVVGSFIVANDDFCISTGTSNNASEVQFLATGGADYYVYWDDKWDNNGFDFTISMEANPISDFIFQVDMSQETVSPSGVGMSFGTPGNEPVIVAMTDMGNGIWTRLLTLTATTVIHYRFVNGDGTGMSVEVESVPMECGVETTVPGVTVREITAGTNGEAFPLVCFSSCEICPDPPIPCTVPDAIICDNFDAYTLSEIGPQADHWNTWTFDPGGVDDALISNTQAASGTQSLLISEANEDDVLLLLGDLVSGNYLLEWDIFVPMGSSAYFNTQKIQDTPGNPDGEFGMEVFMNANGTGTLNATVNDVTTFDYAQEEWIKVSLSIDLDNDWIVLQIDGNYIYAWPASATATDSNGLLQLGAADFFGNTGNLYFVDNVLFKPLPACLDGSIICDSYEAYLSNSLTGPQAAWWSTWSGIVETEEDGIVSDEQAFDGNVSMKIGVGGAPPIVSQDVLLLLGDRSSGNYSLEWQMYIPAGHVAYYNIQNAEDVSAPTFNFEIGFGTDNMGNTETFGTATIYGTDGEGNTFTYPEDTWFKVIHFIDLDNNTMTVHVNGIDVETSAYTGDLGAIDFFATNTDNTCYIDAVRFVELEPIVLQVDATFSVNMMQETLAGDAMINGSMTGGVDMAMTDMGSNVWSITLPVMQNATMTYRFKTDATTSENVPAACADNNGDRTITTTDANITVDLVCYESCNADCPVAVQDLELANAISMYPNPAKLMTNVVYDFEIATDFTLHLINHLGQVVYEKTIKADLKGNVKIDLSNVAKGMYFLQVTDGEIQFSEKLVVN